MDEAAVKAQGRVVAPPEPKYLQICYRCGGNDGKYATTKSADYKCKQCKRTEFSTDIQSRHMQEHNEVYLNGGSKGADDFHRCNKCRQSEAHCKAHNTCNRCTNCGELSQPGYGARWCHCKDIKKEHKVDAKDLVLVKG